MAGCGGGGGSTGTTLSGNTQVVVLASSTANDQLSELTLNITGINLTNKDGKTVTLLNTPQYVEFMHLNGGIESLTTVSIPQDVYTSATVSVSDGVPLCETVDPSSGNSGNLFSTDSPRRRSDFESISAHHGYWNQHGSGAEFAGFKINKLLQLCSNSDRCRPV
jgi:hypothetical protein